MKIGQIILLLSHNFVSYALPVPDSFGDIQSGLTKITQGNVGGGLNEAGQGLSEISNHITGLASQYAGIGIGQAAGALTNGGIYLAEGALNAVGDGNGASNLENKRQDTVNHVTSDATDVSTQIVAPVLVLGIAIALGALDAPEASVDILAEEAATLAEEGGALAGAGETVTAAGAREGGSLIGESTGAAGREGLAAGESDSASLTTLCKRGVGVCGAGPSTGRPALTTGENPYTPLDSGSGPAKGVNPLSVKTLNPGISGGGKAAGAAGNGGLDAAATGVRGSEDFGTNGVFPQAGWDAKTAGGDEFTIDQIHTTDTRADWANGGNPMNFKTTSAGGTADVASPAAIIETGSSMEKYGYPIVADPFAEADPLSKSAGGAGPQIARWLETLAGKGDAGVDFGIDSKSAVTIDNSHSA